MRRVRGLGVWIGMALLAPGAAHAGALALEAPREGQLSLVGPVAVAIELPAPARKAAAELRIDGAPVPLGGFTLRGRTLRGVVEGLGAGRHELEVVAGGPHGGSLSSWFELVELENPDQCEVLNNAACL